jgi:KaiC/GvpD/RAD55 family RecA-like ATPase
LLYGVNGGGGFVLLSGEIGAGKTTVCRCFLEQIPRRCIRAADEGQERDWVQVSSLSAGSHCPRSSPSLIWLRRKRP